MKCNCARRATGSENENAQIAQIHGKLLPNGPRKSRSIRVKADCLCWSRIATVFTAPLRFASRFEVVQQIESVHFVRQQIDADKLQVANYAESSCSSPARTWKYCIFIFDCCNAAFCSSGERMFDRIAQNPETNRRIGILPVLQIGQDVNLPGGFTSHVIPGMASESDTKSANALLVRKRDPVSAGENLATLRMTLTGVATPSWASILRTA